MYYTNKLIKCSCVAINTHYDYIWCPYNCTLNIQYSDKTISVDRKSHLSQMLLKHKQRVVLMTFLPENAIRWLLSHHQIETTLENCVRPWTAKHRTNPKTK